MERNRKNSSDKFFEAVFDDQENHKDDSILKGELRWMCKYYPYENECDASHDAHGHDIFYSVSSDSEREQTSLPDSPLQQKKSLDIESLLSQDADNCSFKLEQLVGFQINEKVKIEDVVISDEIIETLKRVEAEHKTDQVVCDSSHETLLAFAEKSHVVKEMIIKDPQWMMRVWRDFSDRFAIVMPDNEEYRDEVIRSLRHLDECETSNKINETPDPVFSKTKMNPIHLFLAGSAMALTSFGTMALFTNAQIIPSVLVGVAIGVFSFFGFKGLYSPANKSNKEMPNNSSIISRKKNEDLISEEEIEEMLDEAIKDSSWFYGDHIREYSTSDAVFLMDENTKALIKATFDMNGTMIYTDASKEDRKMLGNIGFFIV